MIKPLTSLRFFFAFCVFLSHLSFLKEDENFKDLFTNLFSEGFLGVSFFFILSGFILALNYREKFKNNTITLKKFYIARLARIYPLFFFTMVASIPVLFSSVKILIYNAFLLQSYIPDKEYYFSYNAPSWSISDEMFFYALFPILISISYKFKSIYKIILCIAFVSVIFLMNIFLPEEKTHYWLYISPFIRVFDFILGIFLFDVCLYIKEKKLNLHKNTHSFLEVFAFIILIVFLLLKNHFEIHYRYSLYYWLPMCLIILTSASTFISNKKSLVTSILSQRTLVYLGEISFSFYLIHYLVIIFVSKHNGFMGVHLQSTSLAFMMFIITLITSIFAFEKIEKPFNKKIKHLFS